MSSKLSSNVCTPQSFPMPNVATTLHVATNHKSACHYTALCLSSIFFRGLTVICVLLSPRLASPRLSTSESETAGSSTFCLSRVCFSPLSSFPPLLAPHESLSPSQACYGYRLATGYRVQRIELVRRAGHQRPGTPSRRARLRQPQWDGYDRTGSRGVEVGSCYPGCWSWIASESRSGCYLGALGFCVFEYKRHRRVSRSHRVRLLQRSLLLQVSLRLRTLPAANEESSLLQTLWESSTCILQGEF